VFEKVKEILIEDLQLSESDIKMEAELISDLGINSLELADLILMCEEKFNIEIKDDDIHKFITVGDVVNYLTEVCAK
jgi:acyl carrier protein